MRSSDFELVGGLGEIDHVGEEDGQLLAVGSDLNALRAGEDRVVDLRRKIFRQLGGERLELLVLLGDDFGGGVQLPLVVIAEAHQPARGAEQLLIALEQLLEVFLLVRTVKDPIGKQALAAAITPSSATKRSSLDITQPSSRDGIWH